MKPAILELSGVDYAYEDGTLALKGADFSLHGGDRSVLLGANGSGKTTLFLVMVGVLTPKTGRVLLQGRPLGDRSAELRELRSRIGLVFQDPDSQLFANTVAEDLSFGPTNQGLPPEEVRSRVEAAMEACGISDLASRPPHCLSYGQKKLAAIAGVVAMGCEALILDEPTSGLDGLHAELVENLLFQLNASGTAILVSTHDAEFAWRFGREAFLMREGRIVARGEPESLYRGRREDLALAHIRIPLIFDAHESLVAALGQERPLPAAPRRREELPLWSRAVLGVGKET